MSWCGPAAFATGLVFFTLALCGMAPATCYAAEDGRYQGPQALAASPDGRTLYVAAADARQVVWVALPGGKVTRRINVPAEPTGLALTPDGSKLIVTCAAPQSIVAVLDAASGKLINAIQAGHTATSPAVSPDGRRLYVCNRFDNDVSVIDLTAAGQVARVPVVREPISAAVTPDAQTVLVANHLPDTRTDGQFKGDISPVVSVIDASTLKTTAIPLPHGSHGLRTLCITPDGKHAFVTHLQANFEMSPFRVDMGWINVNVVSIIDVQRRKVVATIGLDEMDLGSGNPYGVTLAAAGQWVCVSLAGSHELCVIDASDLLGEFARRTMQPMMAVWPIYLSLGESLWRRIRLPGQGPRGLAAAGSKVYVAEYFSDSVAVVDSLESAEPSVTAIALGPPPVLTPQRRGELLFHDATICYQQWQSCASCHPDGRVDGLNWDLMNDGSGNPKNTKSMLLAHQTPPAMAEGVRASAEQAVRAGLLHILFASRSDEEASAIDAYLRSLRPTPSPQLINGRLSLAAERGRSLFFSQRVACHRCHPPPLYTDLKMHDVGSRGPKEWIDRFDSPTLVEVWRTAPYLHDGRYAAIEQLLSEGRHGLRGRRGKDLDEKDLRDLAEFVRSL